MKKKIPKISTTQIIMFGFLIVIFIGSILLSLPISTAGDKSISYIDALFTATTATCVTGLVTVPTFSTWSLFGQIVILLLIQTGGLGVITVVSGLMIAIRKKFGIADRLLIQDAFNLNTMSGLIRFVKKVIYGTLAVEFAGALMYMTVFVPDFGLRGIWISFFNSVSAFCNAGIDIFSENSLCDYALNPIINSTTNFLIIAGGIGYVVWWDLIHALKKFRVQKLRCLRTLNLHSKIAIASTLILLTAGTVLIFIFEYNNPDTMKNLCLFDKLQLSFFQAVTTRTAGFITIPQQNLSDPSSIVSLILMFIGGSPVGTAGGVKTVTIAVMIIAAVSTIKNRNEICIFNRNIPQQAVIKAVAVIFMSFSITLISTVLLSFTSGASFMDVAYEAVSATATVGLSRNLTASLNTISKIIIIMSMYLGRIGPISLAFAFKTRKLNQNNIKNPTEEISVG